MNKFKFIAEEKITRITRKCKIQWTSNNWQDVLDFITSASNFRGYNLMPDNTLTIMCKNDEYEIRVNDTITKTDNQLLQPNDTVEFDRMAKLAHRREAIEQAHRDHGLLDLNKIFKAC
jgi:hypothetical protein